MGYHIIVHDLRDFVRRCDTRQAAFDNAIKSAIVNGGKEEMDLENISDMESYYSFCHQLLHWVPDVSTEGDALLRKLLVFYWLFNQPELAQYQTPIRPESINDDPQWLTFWLVTFARELGKFLDTPASTTAIRTFYQSPLYNVESKLWQDEPPNGWASFNQFFARRWKDIRIARPLSPNDSGDNVIVSCADSRFNGNWPVDKGVVTLKSFQWPVSKLLQGEEFDGKSFMHAFLGPTDYHRQHAPVSGKVIQAKVIQEQVYLQVTKDPENVGLAPNRGLLVPKAPPQPQGSRGKDLYRLEAPDDGGYQWCQTRGLIIIETERYGKVAILPIGMAHVSSVVLSVSVGEVVDKGSEISYFQFGGSDVVMVFERDVQYTAKKGDKCNRDRKEMVDAMGLSSIVDIQMRRLRLGLPYHYQYAKFDEREAGAILRCSDPSSTIVSQASLPFSSNIYLDTRSYISNILYIMRPSFWSYVLMAGHCVALGDLAALLAFHDDLSTLLELVGLVDGLADTLSSASNVTIVAPTNEAFAKVPRDVPEGEAIELHNDTIAIGALLANHVFRGVYPSNVITDIPTFAQTLLDDSYITERQPFSNFTGGAYNGLVKNGDDVCILSGEQTISTVTEADITLGEGITIHKIDTVLSFGAPLQLFTYQAGYLATNAALEAAHLGFSLGETGADVQGLNISDYTIFVPSDEAFESIDSVLESADTETLREVFRYHIIPNNVIFSPSLSNVTVPSLQGANLTFTALPDGSAWVNNAKITFPNTILYNGIAHVIDSVLSLGDFDRASLKPSAPASERVAFPRASPVSTLPFSSVAFSTDRMTYTTTLELLQTIAAIATPSAEATMTLSGQPVPTQTGSGGGIFPSAILTLSVIMGAVAFLF
ncbi:hypothetical protein NUW58_g399 [Xylaria curta]|uniref:Uncharacterized protein n=1 Tax=Xylaria curta TaxID=42375 RepID=A0ACC1PS50_9PEZI|nr:hypothetical protein NUW58_g399 [Xylaria curta]